MPTQVNVIQYECDYCHSKFTKKEDAKDHEPICRDHQIFVKSWSGTSWAKPNFDVYCLELLFLLKRHYKTIQEWNPSTIFEYRIGRYLDDGRSIFYGDLLRAYNICQTCWKEHKQSYDAINCDHKGY